MRVISAQDLTTIELATREDLMARATSCATVEIAGVTLAVRGDDPELCAAFMRRFRDHRFDGGAQIDYYVVRDACGYVFFTEGQAAMCWPHCDLPVDALLFLTDAAAMSALIQSDDGLTSYHAAVVERDGAVAALVADSNGGKTTTTLACARIGMRIYSDERLIVREGIVQPFLRTCNVRADGMRRLLHDDPTDRLARALAVTAAGDFSFVDVFGARAAAPPARLAALFVIAEDRRGRAEVQPISTYSALPALVRWAHASCDRLTRAARAGRFLKDVACYRLSLGTPHQTAVLIDEKLRGR